MLSALHQFVIVFQGGLREGRGGEGGRASGVEIRDE